MLRTSAAGNSGRLARVVALDGMRGVAVLGVVCFHYGVGIGWTGVQLFFVLSGFLITSILMSSRESSLVAYLKGFYWRRSLRIFPLYFAFLFVVVFLSLLLGITPAFRQQWPYLFTYTFNFVRTSADYIYPRYWGHLWSLSVEEQFYLFWPLAVFFLPRRAFVWLLCGLLIETPLLRFAIERSLQASVAPDAIGNVIYNLTPCQLDAFASGALVACAREAGVLRVPLRGWLLGSVVVVAAGLINLWSIPSSLPIGFLTFGYPLNMPYHYQSTWGYTLLNLWSAGLIAVLLSANSLSRLLEHRLLVWVGAISYGVYVWHLPVLQIVRQVTPPYAPQSLMGAVVFLVYLVVSLGLSQLSYVAFERWFLDLKNATTVGKRC